MNIAIVTGASSGLGAAFADEMNTALYDEVWLVARREERLKEFAERDSRCVPVVLDLCSEADINKLTSLLNTKGAEISLLINCAGMGKRGDFEGNTARDISATMDLNCRSLALVTHACLPYMKENSGIINISSSAAFLPQPGFNIYAASKSFVLNFSRALAYELKSRKINVTCVCPGPINTEFLGKALGNPDAQFTGIRALCVADPHKLAAKSLKCNRNGRKLLVYGFMQKLLHFASKLVPTDVILFFETSVFKING
ncbi:MAG: SDR family NAD(P)-dependent oxidoreductase [Clostridia bacterium]|nr:SDR family NAD(P)-dependent oxidoreductase [Clostridia bacterium]